MQAESDLARERSDLHNGLKDYYSAKAALNHAVGIQNYLKETNMFMLLIKLNYNMMKIESWKN